MECVNTFVSIGDDRFLYLCAAHRGNLAGMYLRYECGDADRGDLGVGVSCYMP